MTKSKLYYRKSPYTALPHGALYVTAQLDWFSQAELSRFRGRYVIIRGQRVISSGKSPDRLLQKFRSKFPKEIPLLAKIIDEETLILVGRRG